MSSTKTKTKTRPTADQKARVIRQLGPFEKYQSALHTTGVYKSTLVTCRYGIPKDLTTAALHSKLVEVWELAVARTILEHPILQVGLLNAYTKKPSWIRLDNVDLAQHIEWQVAGSEKYESLFDNALMKDLNADYPNMETLPGWRLILTRQDGGSFVDAAFSWNHANCDGMSGKIFHETLLSQLNKRSDSDQPALENHLVKTNASAANIPPTGDAIAKWPISLRHAAHLVWKELKPPVFAVATPTHATWAPIRVSPCKTQLRHLSIDNDTLQVVLAACRTHKTTLTGLFHAIALVSLVSQLPESKAPAMLSGTAVNLRRHIATSPPGYAWFNPQKTMSNYVSVMDHTFHKGLVSNIRGLVQSRSDEPERNAALEDVVWSVSVGVREEIQARLELGLKNEVVGLMKVVGNWETYVKDELKKPRGGTFGITNLGVIESTEKGVEDGTGWTIQKAMFSLSAAVFGAVFSISTMSVKGGELSINVTWQEDVVDASIGEKLVADMESWLRHIGRQS